MKKCCDTCHYERREDGKRWCGHRHLRRWAPMDENNGVWCGCYIPDPDKEKGEEE